MSKGFHAFHGGHILLDLASMQPLLQPPQAHPLADVRVRHQPVPVHQTGHGFAPGSHGAPAILDLSDGGGFRLKARMESDIVVCQTLQGQQVCFCLGREGMAEHA